jgi:hypothetical protein
MQAPACATTERHAGLKETNMTTRTLSLAKGGHKYVFRYSPGCEDDIVDAIMELAEDDESPVDWLDAATLSFQITQNAAQDCLEAMSPTDEQAS